MSSVLAGLVCTDHCSWIVPVACSAIAPFLLIFGVFFIRTSISARIQRFKPKTSLANGPRWLISKHKKDKAVEVLERLRDKEAVQAGRPQAEADAIEEALENKVEKGPWLDLFVGSHFADRDLPD